MKTSKSTLTVARMALRAARDSLLITISSVNKIQKEQCRDNREDVMKEQDKKMIGNIVVMAVCLIMLVFGTFWKKIGLEAILFGTRIAM